MPKMSLSIEARIRRMTPVAAPPEQRTQVTALARAIEGMSHTPKRRGSRCQFVGPDGAATAVPDSIFFVLARVAEVMARGDAVAMVIKKMQDRDGDH